MNDAELRHAAKACRLPPIEHAAHRRAIADALRVAALKIADYDEWSGRYGIHGGRDAAAVHALANKYAEQADYALRLAKTLEGEEP